MKATAGVGGLALLAGVWLSGCDSTACHPMDVVGPPNFNVTLWVAAAVLPDDLVVLLEGDGTISRTLPEILDDPSYDPPCWLGELSDGPFYGSSKDAAAPPADRISCGWARHSVLGTFSAEAAGYQDVALMLVVIPEESDAECGPDTYYPPSKAEVELEPL